MSLPRIGKAAADAGPPAFPLLAEDVPLRAPAALAALAAGGLAIAAAAALSRGADAGWQHVLSAAVFVAGCGLAVFVVICRQYRTVVTTRTIEGTTGPFRLVVPTGSVEGAVARPASSWRRLFAGEEIEIRYTLGAGVAVLPSRRAAEFVATLDEAA